MARKLISFVVAAAVLSTVAFAYTSSTDSSSLSGSWAGTIAIPEKGRRGDKEPLHATFKQNGSELTGTLGPDEKSQLAISKGHVEVTKFGTIVTFDMVGPNFAAHFELVPSGGVLRGVAKLDTEKATAAVELQILK